MDVPEPGTGMQTPFSSGEERRYPISLIEVLEQDPTSFGSGADQAGKATPTSKALLRMSLNDVNVFSLNLIHKSER